VLASIINIFVRRFYTGFFKCVILLMQRIYRSFATTVSQLKICDFSVEPYRGFEVL
jgi:hypothetical protein